MNFANHQTEKKLGYSNHATSIPDLIPVKDYFDDALASYGNSSARPLLKKIIEKLKSLRSRSVSSETAQASYI